MPAVDAPTVYLHIGTPKSATTHIQTRFAKNHRRAADQGLLWPGPGWGFHGAAAKELRALGNGESLNPDGPWMRMAEQARTWQGDRVLISMEWLVSCSSHQVKVAVDSLAPCRVEVVITVRDLLRSFVAQWQEMMKNNRTWAWDRFVAEAKRKRRRGAAGGTFWRQHDVPAIVKRWSKAVPEDRFHIVTVPPRGGDRDLVWKRFCEVVGIDGSDFEQPGRDNPSLGVVSSVLMQRINEAAKGRGFSNRDYKRVVYRAIGLKTLAPRRGDEAPIAVDKATDRWVRERAAKMIGQIRGLDARVVGDLEDLVPGERLKGRVPSEVAESEVLDLAVDALVDLGLRQQEEIARLRTKLDQARLRAGRRSGSVVG